MHNRGEGIASRDIYVGATGYVLNNLTEIDQVRRIDDVSADVRCFTDVPGEMEGATLAIGIGITGTLLDWNMLLLREIPTNLLLYFANQSTPNSSLLLSCNWPMTVLQRHLRRLDVHFIQNLFHLHDDLAIAENDDGVCALIGDELGVSDRDRFGGGVHRLRGKFLRDIYRASAPSGGRRSCQQARASPLVIVGTCASVCCRGCGL